MAKKPVQEIQRFRINAGKLEKKTDHLSVEEPLEIILSQQGRKPFSLAITMRTPGNDEELAAGFLFSEGIIKNKNDMLALAADPEAANPTNNITITLSQQLNFEPSQLQRHFFTNSSCGVCGKTSLQALELLHQPTLSRHTHVTGSVLCQLPEQLRQHQQQFNMTGSVHSAAVFSPQGKLLLLREDVGRHNAMDKLIGALLRDNQLALLKEALVLVSGRASFELVQKALMADIPILAAIGAPTTLAHQLASRHDMTLVGFLKADSFNVYSAPERIN